MPIYKAPVEDLLFLLSDVFQVGRYDNLPGFADASADVRGAILAEAAKFCEEVLTPLNRIGDVEGCTRHDDGSVTHAQGLQGGLQAICRRRLDGHFGAGRVRRPGPAGDVDGRGQRDDELGQHGLRHVSRPHPGRDRRADPARHARAEGDLSAEHGRGPLDRHHEPDRAALRHRSRPAPHQGGEAGRRQLQASPAPRSSSRPASTTSPRTSCISCSRASKARQPASRGISLFVVPKFLPERRRLARRSATASPAARSKRRWASTATRPA